MAINSFLVDVPYIPTTESSGHDIDPCNFRVLVLSMRCATLIVANYTGLDGEISKAWFRLLQVWLRPQFLRLYD